MELRLFGKVVMKMSRIEWGSAPNAADDPWYGTFQGSDVRLLKCGVAGTWSCYFVGTRLSADFKTREMAREALEKHLGIFVPRDAV
jgi:hypothetical protein